MVALPRRSFLGRVAAAAAAFGAAPALTAMSEPSAFAPSELDTWLMSMKGTEKVIYDAVSAGGATDGLIFARNFMTMSQEKLGTKDNEMSVIVSFRHFATPFGYSDAMWAKYPPLADVSMVDDPKTKKRAKRNWLLHDDLEGFPGASLPAVRAKGVNFTVCGAATAFIAGVLAGKTGNAKTIEAELAANLIPGARMVPAGVVVVQRAQKNGFAYTYTG